MPKRTRRTTRRTTSNSPRRRSSRYKRAINIKQISLGYAGLSILSNGLFNLNPVQFIAGTGARGGGGLGGGFAPASGTLNISIREIFDWVGTGNTGSTTLQEAIWTNVKKNSLMMVGGLVGLKAVDILISKSGVSRTFNKGVRAIGMGQLVKM